MPGARAVKCAAALGDGQAEILQILDWILTEIGAGMCLLPRSTEERTWNNAHERCKSIINNYRDGIGLFQITAKAGRKEDNGTSTAISGER